MYYIFQLSNLNNTPISPSTENQPDTCQSAHNSYSPSGLSLKVVYRPRSGQRFFSGLFSFPEETVECPADVFMSLDSSLRLQGLSMYMNMGCPWLTLGQLTFTGMVHTLYFPGALGLDQFCIDHNDPGVSNSALIIYSTLQESRLPLGNFMTLLPGPNSTALSVAFCFHELGQFPSSPRTQYVYEHGMSVAHSGTVDMVHTLYFPGALGLDQFCIDHNDPGVSNSALIIYSTLQESRLPLGNFMTLLPGPNSTALSVAFCFHELGQFPSSPRTQYVYEHGMSVAHSGTVDIYRHGPYLVLSWSTWFRPVLH